MQITDIRRGKDGAEKYHLYVDGNYLLTVHEQVYYENHLAVGQTVTGSDLDHLQQQSEFIWAKSLALQHLSRRSMSAKQLRDKLRERVGEDAAEMAVQRMAELGYLDDADYAGRLARDMTRLRSYGPDRVRRELQARGIDKELAALTVEELDSEPQEAILGLLEGKLARLAQETFESDDPKDRNRLFGRLTRMGYGFDDIRQAWRLYCEEHEE